MNTTCTSIATRRDLEPDAEGLDNTTTYLLHFGQGHLPLVLRYQMDSNLASSATIVIVAFTSVAAFFAVGSIAAVATGLRRSPSWSLMGCLLRLIIAAVADFEIGA